ncbi:Uncharacterised protein [Cedecea neteri]|uniref:Uncharacterized protein n=1 Tax=Cedecea neteri TaxID=158822 RepID=A0A2X3JBS4_9ENTR|nr:Uncharacterised protein [Cedecea neteri]
MEISNTVIQGAITLLFSVVSFGLSIWVRNLTTTIEKLRDGQAEMHLLFQLKTDAARDHAQVLQIFYGYQAVDGTHQRAHGPSD